MATWEVGQSIVWGLKVYDTAGALADLGGGNPTATVTKPDLTTTTATVSKDSTGTYRATVTASAAGRWKVVWTGSGTNSGGLPYTDVADVLDYSRLIISLSEARAALNLPASATTNDDELRAYIAAATQVIEDIVGPVLGATVVETRDGGRPAIALHKLPATVTTVVEDGVTLTSDDWCVDSAGVLWRGSLPGYGTWASGAANVVVTYTVGASSLAPNVILAAADLIRHLYARQQSPRPTLGTLTDPTMGVTPSGFAVPNAVLELLKPSAAGRAPGIA